MSLKQNQIDRINAIIEEVEAPVKKWPYEEDVFVISIDGIIYSAPHNKEIINKIIADIPNRRSSTICLRQTRAII